MRVRNPNRGQFTPAATKAAVQAFINGLGAGGANPSFDDVRAAVSGFDVDTPDGTVHQALLDAGFEVVDE